MDKELKGEGNSLNYTFRMHDPRIGRFFAVDPLTAKFPHLTPYQFASNSPIVLRELEGLEGKMYTLDLNVEKPVLKFDYEKDLDYWPNFLEPDYITVTVKGPENSEIKYTFTRFGSTGAMHNGEFGEAPHIDDFPKFQKDPLGALASGKYVPERTVKVHILRDAVIALVLRRVMKTGNGRGRSNIDPEEQSLYNLVDNKVATGNGGRKFWFMNSIFKGKKIYQRDDLIDPIKLDDKNRTNIERMEEGLAPIGPDGKSMEIHHLIQSDNGSFAEVTYSFHKSNYATIHIFYGNNKKPVDLKVDRDWFDAFRSEYWKSRANDFNNTGGNNGN
jgi:RHS repeat-associated protein